MINVVVAHVAMWSVRLSPYTCPDDLPAVLGVLQKKLRAFCKSPRNGKPTPKANVHKLMVRFGQIETDRVELEELLKEMLFGVRKFAKWNRPRNGSRPLFGTVSRYDDPSKVDPDAEFVDIYALVGNVAMSVAAECAPDQLPTK